MNLKEHPFRRWVLVYCGFGMLLLLTTGCASLSNWKNERAFNEEWQEVLKKVPPSARVVVLPFEVKVYEFQSGHSKMPANAGEVAKNWGEQARDRVEAELHSRGIKVLSREILKQAEAEVVHSQTGIVDPATAAKFGKAVGATHIMFGRLLVRYSYGSGNGYSIYKIINIESVQIIGMALREMKDAF